MRAALLIAVLSVVSAAIVGSFFAAVLQHLLASTSIALTVR